MAALLLGFMLFLAMAKHSVANFCECNTGLSDTVLQKNIDYACGNGADCSAIQQNGACYNPSTVRDHCNYAVNSYYQRRGQVTGSCDFSGTATVVVAAPSAASGCVYQSSPSTTPITGGGTPTTGGTPPVGGTPTTGATPTPPTAGGTPGLGGTPATGGTPITGGTNTPTGMLPGGTGSGIGIAPLGAGFDNGCVTLLSRSMAYMLIMSLSLTTVLSGILCQMI